ncbi:MAG: hypothetical protein IJ642_01195 [Oscillospiraceae bacterium]|nr:hypothetical protein [Oscillospiraceae bacterium]
MRRKIRIITVNHQKYAWWFNFSHGIKLHLSPAEDKTSVITVCFPCEISDQFYTVFPLFLTMRKKEHFCRIKIIEPRMTALLLADLQNHFQTRKFISLNGFDLLAEMGWHILKIENVSDW